MDRRCHLSPLVTSLATVRDTITSYEPDGGRIGARHSGRGTVQDAAALHAPVLASPSVRDECAECQGLAQRLYRVAEGKEPTGAFVRDVNRTLERLETRMGATVDECALARR